MELSRAIKEGSPYVSSLPVSFDGSCSGLQHLCAMTRAREGELVNLTPHEVPQDVYQEVADRVKARLEKEKNPYDHVFSQLVSNG
jgi:DNA-directed RNA polymerase